VTLLLSDTLIVFVSDDDDDDDDADDEDDDNNKRIFQDELTRYCLKDADTVRRGNEGYKLYKNVFTRLLSQATYGAI